jgi:hypothetical protein
LATLAMSMRRWLPFLVTSLALVANASLTSPVVRQDVAAGGGGVIEQCATEVIRAENSLYCLPCSTDGKECPKDCCLGTNPGSVETTAVVCQVGGCCLRAMDDHGGNGMFVREPLSATKRKEGTRRCESFKETSACLSCAYVYADDALVNCSSALGVDVPARDQPYEGTQCAQKDDSSGAAADDASRKDSGNHDAKNASSAKDDAKEKSATESKKDQSGSATSGSSVGMIVGGSVGGGVALVCLCALALFCCRKRQREKDTSVPFAPSAKHVAAAMLPLPVPHPAMKRIESEAELGSQDKSKAERDGYDSELAASAETSEALARRRKNKSCLSPLDRPLPATPPESDDGGSENDVITPHPATLGSRSSADDPGFDESAPQI